MGLNYAIANLISVVVYFTTILIFVDAILTWIPSVSSYHPAVRLLRSITALIYAPIRKIIPPEKTGFIDISPMIAILALQIIGNILIQILVTRG